MYLKLYFLMICYVFTTGSSSKIDSLCSNNSCTNLLKETIIEADSSPNHDPRDSSTLQQISVKATNQQTPSVSEDTSHHSNLHFVGLFIVIGVIVIILFIAFYTNLCSKYFVVCAEWEKKRNENSLLDY